MTPSDQRRLAVVDLGSNTFRLVVFAHLPGRPPRMIDEIRDPVRLSAGMTDGVILPEAIERAAHAADAYARFCRTVGIDEVVAVATSAIREAENQEEVLNAVAGADGLDVRVISTEEEAVYGYLGAINATTLNDGGVLDVGGGSMQLSRVRNRLMTDFVSYRLGAVRATERFLTDDPPKKRQIKALRSHVEEVLAGVDWIEGLGDRLLGIGGSIRTLAAMAQRRAEYPLREIHGFPLTGTALEELIGEMVERDARGRAKLPGLKADRADIVLGAALVVAEVMEQTGVAAIEVCAGGLREGVYFERILLDDPPLIDDVRKATVRGLAEGYGADMIHAKQVAFIADRIYRELSAVGLQDDDAIEREWLWAASMLHDVGVLIDYHDHHKHSQYLVLNAGLPGFDHRELAIIATLIRGHRKRLPGVGPYGPLLAKGDQSRIDRLSVCLRLAEQLERGRSRAVKGLTAATDDATLRLTVECDSDPSIAIWAASQEREAVERAFGLALEIV